MARLFGPNFRATFWACSNDSRMTMAAPSPSNTAIIPCRLLGSEFVLFKVENSRLKFFGSDCEHSTGSERRLLKWAVLKKLTLRQGSPRNLGLAVAQLSVPIGILFFLDFGIGSKSCASDLKRYFSNFRSFFSDTKVKCCQEHGANGVHSKDAAYQGEDSVHLRRRMGTEIFTLCRKSLRFQSNVSPVFWQLTGSCEASVR